MRVTIPPIDRCKCGSEAIAEASFIWTWRVHCTKCNASTGWITIDGDTPEAARAHAINKWNGTYGICPELYRNRFNV